LNFHKITRAIRPLNKKKDPIDQFEDIPWGKAKVGQIILIKKGEEIPADILLV
jgi:magnesium-transporting ATPase (P-type)